MPATRKKHPNATRKTIQIAGENYTVWVSLPFSDAEVNGILTELREEKLRYRENIERDRKRKREVSRGRRESESNGSLSGSGASSDLGRFLDSARWAEADTARVDEIERLKAENWCQERDLGYERERVRGLEEDVRRMGERIRVLEAKAAAARELLDV